MNTIKNSDTRKIQLAIANNIISSINNERESERERETDRQTDRQTDRDRDRVINDEADKRTVIK